MVEKNELTDKMSFWSAWNSQIKSQSGVDSILASFIINNDT